MYCASMVLCDVAKPLISQNKTESQVNVNLTWLIQISLSMLCNFYEWNPFFFVDILPQEYRAPHWPTLTTIWSLVFVPGHRWPSGGFRIARVTWTRDRCAHGHTVTLSIRCANQPPSYKLIARTQSSREHHNCVNTSTTTYQSDSTSLALFKNIGSSSKSDAPWPQCQSSTDHQSVYSNWISSNFHHYQHSPLNRKTTLLFASTQTTQMFQFCLAIVSNIQ